MRATSADLLIFLALIGGAVTLVCVYDIKSPDAIATLVGALIGAAALLLGNYISRCNLLHKAREESKERVRKLKATISAELVNVAAGLIGTKDTIDAAVGQAQSGGSLPDHVDLTTDTPRPMPFTDNLASELLILAQSEVDVLATLRSNLHITRMIMDEVTLGKRSFSLLAAQQIMESIRHVIGILAEAFDRFAPERQLQLLGKDPELASTLLRRLAGTNACQRAGGETNMNESSMSSINRKRILVGLIAALGIIGLAVALPVIYEGVVIRNTINRFRLDQAVQAEKDKREKPSAEELLNPPFMKKYGLDLNAYLDKKGYFSPNGAHWKHWGTETKTAAVLMWQGQDQLGAWEIRSLNHCVDRYYVENGDSQIVVDVLNACIAERSRPAAW